MSNFMAKKKLQIIAKELGCKTVLDDIDNRFGEFKPEIQIYEREINVFVIVYQYNDINKLRLVVSKINSNDIRYELTLYMQKTDLSTDKYDDNVVRCTGTRLDILTCLEQNGDTLYKILEGNYNYFYAAYELIKYVRDKYMNSMFICGHFRYKFVDGAFILYKDVWLTDDIGYMQMYCVQGFDDKLKITNSLVMQKSNGKYKQLLEKVVYNDSLYDLRSAYESMKYLWVTSPQEKEISKKFS